MLISAPRFYPIVDDLKDLSQLTQHGFPWIQFRNKQARQQQLQEARSLFERHRRHPQQKLILNDDVASAIEFKFAGVHLGQDDLSVLRDPRWRATLKEQQILLGISTHNPDEFERALQHQPDYIAFGPLFASSNKPALVPQPHQLVRSWLTRWRQQTTVPFIAIGGIEAHNFEQALALGFNTLASIGWAKRWTTQPPPLS